MLISILMPTRKKIDFVKKSVSSIINNCYSPNNFEILFGIDEDDVDTAKEIDFFMKDYSSINYKIIYSERFYYKGFHLYMKKLFDFSCGKLLWLFPDDVVVNTKYWDKILEKFQDSFYLKVDLGREYDVWKYSLVPIISRKWIEITGRVSENSQTDCWLGDTAVDLSIVIDVQIQCTIFNDANSHQHNITHYLSEEVQNERRKDVEKIKKFLENI